MALRDIFGGSRGTPRSPNWGSGFCRGGVGRRRPTARSLRLGERAIPTLGERGALCALVMLGRVRASRLVSTRPRRPCPLHLHFKIQFQPENSFLDRIYRIGAQRRKTANGSPPGEQSESINKSVFRKRPTPQNDPIGFTLIHSPSVLSVSFDSLRSLLRSCLRQSISLWSVVVNSAGFGFKVTLASIVAALVRCFQSAREEGDFLIFIGIPDESASGFGAGHDPEATELHCVD